MCLVAMLNWGSLLELVLCFVYQSNFSCVRDGLFESNEATPMILAVKKLLGLCPFGAGRQHSTVCIPLPGAYSTLVLS